MKAPWITAIVLGGCIANKPLPSVAPGYPCGVDGIVCITQHGCCDIGDTCGGEPNSVGCPSGMCCFIGDPGTYNRKIYHQKNFGVIQ